MLEVESRTFLTIMYLSASLLDDSRLNTKIVCYVGFEVLIELTKKCVVFWDVTPCSPVKAHPIFRTSYASVFKAKDMLSGGR
jgi:hypothetical protein